MLMILLYLLDLLRNCKLHLMLLMLYYDLALTMNAAQSKIMIVLKTSSGELPSIFVWVHPFGG